MLSKSFASIEWSFYDSLNQQIPPKIVQIKLKNNGMQYWCVYYSSLFKFSDDASFILVFLSSVLIYNLHFQFYFNSFIIFILTDLNIIFFKFIFSSFILMGPLTSADSGVWFANVDRRAETFEFWSDLMPNRVQLFTEWTPGGVKLQTHKNTVSSSAYRRNIGCQQAANIYGQSGCQTDRFQSN